jgi:hypothetical protein
LPETKATTTTPITPPPAAIMCGCGSGPGRLALGSNEKSF